MARFASAGLGRKTALLGNPGPRKIMRIVGALGMSYGGANHRNLAYDAGATGPVAPYQTTGVSYTKGVSRVTQGGNRYTPRIDIPAPAGAFVSSNWDILYPDYAESGASYTQWDSVVNYNGRNWMAKQTIAAPAGPFDETKWQPLFFYSDVTFAWMDCTQPFDTSSAGIDRVHNILETKAPWHNIGQYNYLSSINYDSQSTRFGMQERDYADANAMWATVDGTGIQTLVQKVGAGFTSGSATVTMSDTSGLVVGMMVFRRKTADGGTANRPFPDGDESLVHIKAINPGVSITLGKWVSTSVQPDYATMDSYTGVTYTGTETINFHNTGLGVAQQNSVRRHLNIVNPPVDAEGLIYCEWLARRLNTFGTLAGKMPKVRTHCLDDTNPQENWSVAGGDFINYTFQGRNIYGTFKWDGTNMRASNADPERAAHYQFKLRFFRALTKYNPGSRVWINGCGAGGLPAVWRKEIDYTMMEGQFGGTGAGEVQSGASVSGVEWWQQSAACAIKNNDYCRFRYGNVINAHVYEANGSSVSSQPVHKCQLFALSTALLVDSRFTYDDRKNPLGDSSSTFGGEFMYRYYIAEYDIALGMPVAPVIDPATPWLTLTGLDLGYGAQTAKVWRREFEKGWVFVNPRYLAGSGNWDVAAYRATFTLPFDVRRPPGCLDPNSDSSLGAADGELIPAGTPITMHARSGLILLKV